MMNAILDGPLPNLNYLMQGLVNTHSVVIRMFHYIVAVVDGSFASNRLGPEVIKLFSCLFYFIREKI